VSGFPCHICKQCCSRTHLAYSETTDL
jgi:hypothetical protein